ncbi:PWWP domain protein [Aspergillus bombycis]|uniref:PWWP domain protein n=1 Tax=Aspergillus bombycis TaxID=109264 RepID=A0A1F8AH82_9EURO|nr:PWWP domain protein [Aspergillus bombycis]OGM51113.1 PWWP domain protein [Aspergillus bombycis]
MAEDTPTASAPAPDAAESVERAPAEPKESAPEATKEKEETANGSKEKPSGDATATEEKKESDEKSTEKPEESAAPAESEAATAPEANGTPASAKKSGSTKRKSTGAVPEHKSKLNRKKSQARMTNLHAKPGEYYLARLRSYPPWPSIICDEEILPETLSGTRPVTAQRADGSYREDYAEGGKRAHERTFPVMFLETNEFAWIPNTDLTPLEPAICKEVSEKGKSKLLLAAYSVAADGHDLEHFKSLLADHQRAIEQEEEEREAQAAAKAAAKVEKDAKKNKRKSMEIVDDEDIDMEDADEEAKKPKSSKKRKKDAEADAEEKPAKTPKTGTKLKLTTPKTPASEKKAPASSKAKQTASSKKSSKAVASDEGEESTPAAPKEPEKQVNPEEAKAKKEKEILFVRHKLQKGFISRDQPPQEEEMTSMSTYFTKLENYQDLEVSIIRSTKINKVLKMIVKLSSIPRDEEFQFRRRAVDLLSKWKTVLDADTTPGPSERKSKANGIHKEDSVETPARGETEGEKEEESKPTKPETKDEEMTDADAKEKTEVPDVAKEESDKTTPKTDEPAVEKATDDKGFEEKTTEEKPTAEKAEEKTAEASA